MAILAEPAAVDVRSAYLTAKEALCSYATRVEASADPDAEKRTPSQPPPAPNA